MKQSSKNGALPATAIRDELLRCVEAAVMSINVSTTTDEQIHRARKKLKRARANLRLLRDAIGKSVYRCENIALRDAARPFSGVRDAAVLCETADTLINATRSSPRRQWLLKVRRTLKHAQHEARTELRGMKAGKGIVTSLNAAMARMRKWNIERTDKRLLCRGLQRTYRRACKAFEIAGADPTPEHLHEWRKQVKYFGQSLEVWQGHGINNVKKLAKRADKLGELLGTDHDLTVFADRLEKLDSAHAARAAIFSDITDRRCDLRDKALKIGGRLFRAKPRAFLRAITR